MGPEGLPKGVSGRWVVPDSELRASPRPDPPMTASLRVLLFMVVMLTAWWWGQGVVGHLV